MTRIIKASEVKPGMEVEFLTRMKIQKNSKWINSHRDMRDDAGHFARVDADAPVIVLSEPAPAQPEEPTEFGARVVVNGRQFVRAYNDSSPWADGKAWDWWTWDELCEMGPVTVIDAAPSWTVPADTPEVPERIEEWDTWEDVPEGVTVANPELNYQYRKASGKIQAMIPIGGGVWRETSLPLSDFPGPWTRVTDA